MRQGNSTNETSLYLQHEPEVSSLTAGEDCMRLAVEPASKPTSMNDIDVETVVVWDIDMKPL